MTISRHGSSNHLSRRSSNVRAVGTIARVVAGELGRQIGKRMRGGSSNDVDQTHTGAATTNQHDEARVFRSRKTNLKKYKKVKRFRNKVVTAMQSQVPLSASRLSSSNSFTLVADQQASCSDMLSLNTFNGTATDRTGANDLYQVMQSYYSTFDKGGVSSADYRNVKLRVLSSYMNIYVKNIDTTTNMNIEVFRYKCKKDISYSSLGGICVPPNSYVTTGLSDLAISDPSVSLFQMPQFTRHCKIMEVKRFKLPPGAQIEWQMSFKKPFTLNGYQLVEAAAAQVGLANKTCGFIILAYGDLVVNGSSDSNFQASGANKLLVRSDRFYHVKPLTEEIGTATTIDIR